MKGTEKCRSSHCLQKSFIIESKGKGVITLDATLSRQQLILRYRQVFDDGDDFDVVKSKAFSVTFDTMSGQSDFYLLADLPENVDEAKRFAKKPAVRLSTLKSTQAINDSTRSSSLLSSIVPVILAYDVDQRTWIDNFIVQNPAQEQPISQTHQNQAAVSASQATTTLAMSKLLYWWDRSSLADREAFIELVTSSGASE